MLRVRDAEAYRYRQLGELPQSRNKLRRIAGYLRLRARNPNA